MAQFRVRLPRLVPLALLLALSCDPPGTRSLPSEGLAGICATPRPGTTDRQGTLADEKAWLRAWTDDLYLWYRDVAARTDLDPTRYATAQDYFEVLKSPLLTASGREKDQLHLAYPTPVWEALARGISPGYGMGVILVSSSTPRKAMVAYVEPDTAAASAGVGRGAEILSVDGIDVANGSDTATVDAGLFPTAAGAVHTFEILDRGATVPRSITLTSAAVTMNPARHGVLQSPGGRRVGYIRLDDFMTLAEGQFADAVTALQAGQVEELVLDLRYSGGGYNLVASQVGYMIAGPSRTSGRFFEKVVFNDKYPDRNPVNAGGVLQPFHPYRHFSANPYAREVLPHFLSLRRVLVITGGETASASEALMNGLAGIDVPIVQIGGATRGRPHGSFAWDNCDTTYLSIQYVVQNAKGFADYADGFVPGGAGPAAFPGCAVPDDFLHELGDPAEARLAAALSYLDTGACPVLPAPQAARLRREAEAERGWSFARPALRVLMQR